MASTAATPPTASWRGGSSSVRFVQLYHHDWDHHSRIKGDIAIRAREVDQPTAALILDLKQRGLLDETLVIWGGEFGRTPVAQSDRRDHHIKGFSLLLAGGGIQGIDHTRLTYRHLGRPFRLTHVHGRVVTEVLA